MLTTCTDCGGLYEAGSEEQAYEKERWCIRCRQNHGIPLSPEAQAALNRGIESGKTGPTVYLGSFEQYAEEE